MAQTLQNKTSGKPHSGDSRRNGGDASLGADGSLARGVALELEDTRTENGATTTITASRHGQDTLDATLEQAVDRAFLSPRVVDQATFDWLAGSLKKLTTEAAMQHRSLSATTIQATTVQAQLQEQLRNLVKDLQGRVDAALKAIPALEARAGRAQALMDRVTNETALSKAREVRDAVIAEVVKQRDSIVTEAVQAALEGTKAKFEKDCTEMVRHALEQARADAILAARTAGIEIATQCGNATKNTSAETISQQARTVSPENHLNFNTAAHTSAAAELQTLIAKQQQLSMQLIAIEDRARTLLFEFDGGAEQSEVRIAAVQQATERALERAEQGEKSLEEAVLRAQMRFQNASTESERRTEAVATEISEQLQALRHDTATTIKEAQARLHANAREQEERLTRMFDGYAERIQAAEAQIERTHAQHAQAMQSQSIEQRARIATIDLQGESRIGETSGSQHTTILHGAITSATEAIAKLEAVKEATALACRTCDEKSHALIHLMDHVEGRMAEIGTKATRDILADGKHTAAPNIATPLTNTDTQQQAMIVSQQLYQLTGQAVQVGQWLSGMLQHWNAMQHNIKQGG